MGATARDLLLFHVFGIPVTRATADIDFAVAMDSWERFSELRVALLASGHFREGKMEHRVYVKTPSVKDEIPVDLIPFGGVAEADVIHWPPDRETVMAVVGFEDAIVAAVHVQVDADLTIPVASLAGIAVLKLFACTTGRRMTKTLSIYTALSPAMRTQEISTDCTARKFSSWRLQTTILNLLEQRYSASMPVNSAALVPLRVFVRFSLSRILRRG